MSSPEKRAKKKVNTTKNITSMTDKNSPEFYHIEFVNNYAQKTNTSLIFP